MVEESIAINLKVADGCRHESVLIGQLVALAMDGMRHAMIWETIHARTYDAEMLEKLQHELAAIDLQAGLLQAMRGELNGALDAMDWIDKEGGVGAEMILGLDGEPASAAAFMVNLAPSGWLDQNRAYISNWYLDYVLLPLRDSDLEQVLAKTHALEQMLKETKQKGYHPHKVLPMVAMPIISQIVRKLIYAEANRQMEILACALERYHLDSANYPEALDVLVPNYIAAVASDPCASGAPIQYRKDGQRYRLWSIALDYENDGGTVDHEAKKPSKTGYLGDWVWEFPE